MKSVLIISNDLDINALQLKNWLIALELKPVLLEEEDDFGLSLVEKFEHYARDCTVAFVIETNVMQRHERPNNQLSPLVQLGWFLRQSGRQRIIFAVQEGATMPPGMDSMIRCTFRQSIMECSEAFRRRLRGLQMTASK